MSCRGISGSWSPRPNLRARSSTAACPAALQVHTGRLGKGGNTPFSPSLDADVAYQATAARRGAGRGDRAWRKTSASLFADDYDA